jgi:hypothetical protein
MVILHNHNSLAAKWSKDGRRNLDLSILDDLTELPKNLKVEGNLILGRTWRLDSTGYVSRTGITELPDNLEVGGNLLLTGVRIRKLPKNFKVGGDILLDGTNITELPDNLEVHGNLDLRFTPIARLPENLVVHGNLNLQYTPIARLPENLTVHGSLNLRRTAIHTIPASLGSAGGFTEKRTLDSIHRPRISPANGRTSVIADCGVSVSTRLDRQPICHQPGKPYDQRKNFGRNDYF